MEPIAFLTTHLKTALLNCGHQWSQSPQFSFDNKHADVSSNVALVTYSQLGEVSAKYSSPAEWATVLLEAFSDSVGTDTKAGSESPIKKAEVAGPGFINFHLNDSYLCSVLQGKNTHVQPNNSHSLIQDKKFIVEFSSPNIAKPFTIGHFRSSIIGDAVASLLESQGATVYRDNHLGDWGTQFGKLIYAIKTWGDESKLAESATPVKDLVELYIRFHAEAELNPELEEEGRRWFARLEQGDTEARRLWQLCVDWSWQEFERLYQLLGIHFTENNGRGYGESFFEDKMKPVVEALEAGGLLSVGDKGALMVNFDESSQLPPLMIQKSDGASLYATRDLATDLYRKQQYGDGVTIINEVGIEQELYFRQLFAIESKLGWFKPSERVHIKHGLYRFKEGKMSTRKGNVIWLNDVIDEAIKRAEKLIVSDMTTDEKELVARQVGIGALKWNDLKSAPERSITFEWEEILSMQGNSGPYLQYTVARCKSILRQQQPSEFKASTVMPLNSKERAVAVFLWRYPEVLARAAREYMPHMVCTYLFELAQSYNQMYATEPVLKANERTDLRLSLTAAVGNTLKQGLEILGIETPERM